MEELTSLVTEVYPEARKKGTHFDFAIVFMDLKGPGCRAKEIGSTVSDRKGTDDSMTLQSQKFQTGDYLDGHHSSNWGAALIRADETVLNSTFLKLFFSQFVK